MDDGGEDAKWGEFFCKWSVVVEGDEKLLEALHLSTLPDNEKFVEAEIQEGALRATSPPMPLLSSLNALEDYLAHLKLAFKVWSGLM